QGRRAACVLRAQSYITAPGFECVDRCCMIHDKDDLDQENAMATAPSSIARQPAPQDNLDAIRQAYYDRISAYYMAPLWSVLQGLVPREPATQCAPAIWRYRDVRPLVAEAGELITAK